MKIDSKIPKVVFPGYYDRDFFALNKGNVMKMTKGHEPTSKAGGMKAHLGSSAGNNPGTSKTCDLSFSDKNKPKGSSSGRHQTAAKESGV